MEVVTFCIIHEGTAWKFYKCSYRENKEGARLGMHMAFFMCFPAANCRQGVVVLYMRLSGQFSNILFFYLKIFYTKKPIKQQATFTQIFLYA